MRACSSFAPRPSWPAMGDGAKLEHSPGGRARVIQEPLQDGGKMQQPGSEKAVRDIGEYDTITFRTLSAAGSGLFIGSWLGGAVATWHYGPTVNRKEGWTALRSTLRTCGNYGVTFVAVGGIYAFTDAVAETIREKKDFVNGAIGGFAAGPVIGIRARSFPVGLGASVAFAALSALVDAGEQTVRTPTNKEYVTYSRKNPRL